MEREDEKIRDENVDAKSPSAPKERPATRRRTALRIGCGVALLGFAFYGVRGVGVLYNAWLYWGWVEDARAYYWATVEGDAVEACERAERLAQREIRRGYSNKATKYEQRRSNAYELAGDYERAAEALRRCGKRIFYPDAWARLDYKRGFKARAFEAYVVKAKRILAAKRKIDATSPNETPIYATFDELSPNETPISATFDATSPNETPIYATFDELSPEQKAATRARVRAEITMENARELRKLSAFPQYVDFLDFMEAEFAALSDDEKNERAEAMRFYREIASDPNVEKLYPTPTETPIDRVNVVD